MADEASHRINSSNAVITGLVLAMAVGFSFYSRTWEPLQSFTKILAVLSLVAGSLQVLAGREVKLAFHGFFVFVVAAAFAYLIVGLAAVVERVVWFNSNTIPSALVAQDYGTYTVNDHRLFKVACESRDALPMIEIREIDARIYARCGKWFPQVYTVAAPAAAFERAQQEVLRLPDDPIVVTPPKLRN